MLANIINFGARRKAIAQQAVRDAAAGPTVIPDEHAAAYAENFELGKSAGIEEGRAAGFKEAYDEAYAANHAEGMKIGAKAAQERIKAILGSEAAKGRAEQAQSFAFDTDIPPEQAIALLAKSPVAAPAAATSGLLAEMSAMQRPTGAAPPATSTGNAWADKFESGAAAARALLGV